MKLKKPEFRTVVLAVAAAILILGSAISNRSSAQGGVLHINPNGGTWNGSSHVASFEMKKGAPMTIPLPERSHYTFDGWRAEGMGWALDGETMEPEGSMDIAFAQEAEITMGGENLTLTASWTPVAYPMTCIDRFGVEELGRSETAVEYGTRVSGSDWGDDSAADAYYEGYTYESCTTHLCDGEENVVYRNFLPCISLGEEPDMFLAEGGSRTIECSREVPEGAVYVSSAPDIVSVEPETGVLTGKGLGKAVISLELADGGVAGDIAVYCFRPTAYYTETTGVPAYPRILHTDNPTNEDAKHDYVIFSQYKQDNQYIASHGCALCCVSEIAQGYGVEDMNPVFLHETAIREVADKLNIPIRKALGTDKNALPLGFYGMKQMLASVGISSKQVYNWEDSADAVEEVTQNLSLGRPVVVIICNNKWNGIQLASGFHFIVLTGIDEDGYVMNTCSSSCRVESTKKSPTCRVTVSQLLNHYLRKTKVKEEKDFFFHMPSGSGCVEFLEITCDKPGKRTLKAQGSGVEFKELKREEKYNWENDQ